MGPAAAGLGGRLLAVVGWGMLEQFFPSTPRSGLAAPVEGNPQRTGRTVLIDRDGVINRNRPDHVKNWAEFEFLPGAVDARVYLARQGWQVVVVTNQALVERGFLSEAELGALLVDHRWRGAATRRNARSLPTATKGQTERRRIPVTCDGAEERSGAGIRATRHARRIDLAGALIPHLAHATH